MVRIMIVVLVLMTGSIARADAPTETADPDTALRMSVIGSAFPLAALGIGVLVASEGSDAPIRDVGGSIAIGAALAGIVTPALGELYARRWFTPGMAMRAGGLVVEAIGLIKGFNNEIGDCSDLGPCHRSGSTIGLIVGGAALYLGGIALDVVGAPAAAREWTARHEVQIVPTALKSKSSTVGGLAVALKF